MNCDLKGLDHGRLLPLAEDFYSIQGEGFHSGKPAYFIRLGGCDTGCPWCDSKQSWNPDNFPPVPVTEIVARAASCPARDVILTGGEPLNYPLDILCTALKAQGFRIFLETSGNSPLSGRFDWICLSPKTRKPPLPPVFNLADELKVVVQTPADFAWAEENSRKVRPDCHLFLQPEWSVSKTVMPEIVNYAKAHPRWNISLQIHKYMDIP